MVVKGGLHSYFVALQDRVEASPEQLASAMAVAEKLSERSQTKLRVIGWYHSHPHITVLPSHVDVRTQGSYQMLDDGFIGIILSTFNQVCESQHLCPTPICNMWYVGSIPH